MIKQTFGMAALALVGVMATAVPANTARAADAKVNCNMSYNLQGWSALYKHAEGAGQVTCSNGQTATVKISVVGGGLTAGKFRVTDGQGKISNVRDISEIYGDYVEAGAEAGVVKSAQAHVLTKGTTSLALSGTGQGIDLGVSVGKFTISKQ